MQDAKINKTSFYFFYFYVVIKQDKSWIIRRTIPFTHPGVFTTRGNSFLVGFPLLLNVQYSFL